MIDDALLMRARQVCSAGFDVSIASVRQLARTQGIDLATAVLHEHFYAADSHAAFMQRAVRGIASPQIPPRLVIVPGAFHKTHHHTGADGRRVFELAEALGWPAERLDVPNLGTMASNAEAIFEVLREQSDRPVILVSLSKGGADVRTALTTPGAQLRSLRGWLSLSGMTLGSPLLTWLRARPFRYWGSRALLALQRQSFFPLHELRDGPKAPLSQSFDLPEGVRAVHVLGFPTVNALSHPWSRRAHQRLAPLGPNDGGGVLLADALRLPGHICPVWGADHYLRPSHDIQPLLLDVLRDLARP